MEYRGKIEIYFLFIWVCVNKEDASVEGRGGQEAFIKLKILHRIICVFYTRRS